MAGKKKGLPRKVPIKERQKRISEGLKLAHASKVEPWLATHCPACGRAYVNGKPVKICHLCKKPIGKSDKWQYVTITLPAGIGEVTVIQHRHCERPDAYV